MAGFSILWLSHNEEQHFIFRPVIARQPPNVRIMQNIETGFASVVRGAGFKKNIEKCKLFLVQTPHNKIMTTFTSDVVNSAFRIGTQIMRGSTQAGRKPSS